MKAHGILGILLDIFEIEMEQVDPCTHGIFNLVGKWRSERYVFHLPLSCYQIFPTPIPTTTLRSVQFSHSVMSDSLSPHGLQHARLSSPSPTPGACSNSSYPSSRWCHPTISSSVIPFSSCLRYFLASESVPMSQFFTSGGQSIGTSAVASVLPMNIQNWFPLGLTGLISLQFNGF